MDFIDDLLEEHLEHLLLSVFLARRSTSVLISLAPLPAHFGPFCHLLDLKSKTIKLFSDKGLWVCWPLTGDPGIWVMSTCFQTDFYCESVGRSGCEYDISYRSRLALQSLDHRNSLCPLNAVFSGLISWWWQLKFLTVMFFDSFRLFQKLSFWNKVNKECVWPLIKLRISILS